MGGRVFAQAPREHVKRTRRESRGEEEVASNGRLGRITTLLEPRAHEQKQTNDCMPGRCCTVAPRRHHRWADGNHTDLHEEGVLAGSNDKRGLRGSLSNRSNDDMEASADGSDSVCVGILAGDSQR